MTERLVAEWSERPFTSVKRRRATVEHRVLVEHHGGVGVDVRHEVRCPDVDGLPDEWTPAEVFEARQHGLDKVTAAAAGWWA
ncbi:hypothetical protein [Halorarius halobius]|uniref:hypothetical protein n=1 Tax=Halorarius halobius TaxID=2962671 RepID=UPI0020CE073E|nr:hypothetical protein [Halorarius halobius]